MITANYKVKDLWIKLYIEKPDGITDVIDLDFVEDMSTEDIELIESKLQLAINRLDIIKKTKE